MKYLGFQTDPNESDFLKSLENAKKITPKNDNH